MEQTERTQQAPPVPTLPPEVVSQALTAEQAARLAAEGKSNISTEKNGKSYWQIVLTNLLTFFNFIWGIIAVLMISLGQFKQLTFLAIIIPNTLIAILLECRAKHTVEQLSVTTDPHATVVRDGVESTINIADIVLGDVIKIEMGQQVPADAVVLSGLAEANESMLTGESNAIRKAEGAKLLAGSFFVGGSVYAKVEHVGRDNYIHTIEKAAKSFKKPASDLFRDLNNLLKYIAIFLIPMAAGMFWSNYAVLENHMDAYGLTTTAEVFNEAIVKTCGAAIGMIPAGIFLLITVTLTLSVIKLSRKRTMVQDMYSIEMLARADVVCLDKTGTITDGTMCVSDLYPLTGMSEQELTAILAAIEGTEQSINPTSRALIERFGTDRTATVRDKIPFSSARKYSAVDLEGVGFFSIGAPHFVPCPLDEATEAQIGTFAAEGKRVLVLASHEALDKEGIALALVAVTDRIRPNAKETIERFQSQDVTVKVISGDHAATVSSIAQRVGVLHAERYISCENVSEEELVAAVDDYAVFGRVTPEQKVLLVKELRRRGHTVAMTGDGVNDTLALKESNCAIAMADGSEVARKSSQIVLMDSDFGTLPDVVYEGRRCINNVRRSATLFLMKTFMAVFFSLFCVCMGRLYSFGPNGTVPLELFVIGLAPVLLALEPNDNRIEGAFIKTVLLRSIPNGLALLVPIVVLTLAYPAGPVCNALVTVAMLSAGFVNLVMLCIPYTKWRAAVVAIAGTLTALIWPATVYLLGDMFDLACLVGHLDMVALTVVCSAAFAALIGLFMRYCMPHIRRLCCRKAQA